MAARSKYTISARGSNVPGRMYRPVAFARIVRPVAGTPRLTVTSGARCAITGRSIAPTTHGTNHIRYVIGDAGDAAQHRCAGRLYSGPARLSRGKRPAFLPRAGRTVRRQCAVRIAADGGGDAAILAALGARAAYPAGMAGRGHPLRHHAETVPARGNRRDRGRADHLHPRSAGQRAQLGLPLLLDPRFLLHGAGAEPAGRAGCAGKISRLSAQYRGRREGRADPAALFRDGRRRAG